MKDLLVNVTFYAFFSAAALLSAAIAIAGEMLYAPFIPVALLLYAFSSRFRDFWSKALSNVAYVEREVHKIAFLMVAGAIPGLYVLTTRELLGALGLLMFWFPIGAVWFMIDFAAVFMRSPKEACEDFFADLWCCLAYPLYKNRH